MSDSASQVGTGSSFADDLRWQLVERIVASSSFVKSPRLCSILLFICELSLQGRNDEINEMNIGERLLGRAPNYDPSVDGIVRSHASRLRQRLEQYFKEEGADEAILLSIPKGGYVPVFEPRTPMDQGASRLAIVAGEKTDAELGDKAVDEPVIGPPPRLILVWLLGTALVLACSCIVCLLVFPRSRMKTIAQKPPAIKHPLWKGLLGPDHPTLVVCSDTGLTILENLTRHNVKLEDYLSGDYRVHPKSSAEATHEAVEVLAEHRYTSIVDLEIVSKLYQIAGVSGSRIQVGYSRDIRPNDLKTGSAILLGTQEGTPWVELFEDQMNFTIKHNQQWGEFSVFNRSPVGNELPRYDASQTDPSHKVYGLVALRRNLDGHGQVLILEGTSMAGTESAADFVFDDARLLPFLNRIRQADGTIPYFELLLRSNNMNGNASQSEIVAYRTSPE